MIGNHNEVIAVLAIPFRDFVRNVSAVCVKGMRVSVAFVPFFGRWRLCISDKGENENDGDGADDLKHIGLFAESDLGFSYNDKSVA